MTSVHLEPVHIEGAKRPFLVGRVYYGGGSYEARSPFDAVFVIVLEGGGKAYAMAAHGKISVMAYGLAARMLLDQYGVKHVDMNRHRRGVTLSAERASGFGELGD